MDFDPKKDYYKILWVSEDATDDEIKKAFRKAAVKYHPDKKWWNKEKFQEINEAHQVIWDKQKRQQYDSFKKGWFWGFGGAGGMWGAWWFGGFQWGGATFDFGDLWDIMWWMFGGWFGWGWAKWPSRWDDLKKKITITFDESYLWVTKKIKYSRLRVVKWAEKKTCKSCNGSGRVVKQIKSPFGVMQTQAACPVCGGSGSSYFKDGKKLGNWWLEQVKEVLEIKVPAGIKTDVYLKYSGKWNEWENGMPAGDLYLQIKVTANKDYIRKWDDIYVTQDVSIYDLVLGGEYEIKHPTGKIKIKIPKWTQVDDKIKVSWKWFGTWWLLSKKWDMFIIPNLKIPRRLSKDDEKLWKKLQKG